MTTVYKAGRRSDGGANRRFMAFKADPEHSVGLRADHPAVLEGRTLFPSTVMGSREVPRLFVSGLNNPKLGKMIRKGPRKGWRVYHLTLEERATCPTSCVVWRDCYGNQMHRARRHRHDKHLITEMGLEIAMLAAKHPGGFLVRLHTLGDFYSVAYVDAWAHLLDLFPALHVFGFTARTEMDGDEDSRAIAAAIARLAEQDWNRFAIRFSRPFPSPQGSMVVEADPHHPAVVVCPAQTERTESCSTCGLCWAPAFRDKTVAFIRHGIKVTRAPRAAVTGASTMAVHTVKHVNREVQIQPDLTDERMFNPNPSRAHLRLAEFDPVIARVIGRRPQAGSDE